MHSSLSFCCLELSGDDYHCPTHPALSPDGCFCQFNTSACVNFYKHDIDALLIVHEAIGKGNTSRVAELTASIDTLGAYGIWEGSLLRRVAAWSSNVDLSDSTASFFNTTLNGDGAIRVSWIKRLDASTTTASFGV